MVVSSNGVTGPGGRLVVMNNIQWAGNYLSAGVTGIDMDLRNFGTTDLTIRLYLEDPIAGPPTNQAVTSFAVTLQAGSNWTHVLFPIAVPDLTVLAGDASTLLSNTTLLRLYHDLNPVFPGKSVLGQLGVDNIRAMANEGGVPVPEPATLMLLATGLAGLGGVVRLRRRS